jgi:glutathione peroxidase-family protein
MAVMLNKILDWCLVALGLSTLVLFAYVVMYIPQAALAREHCLSKGYPKVEVTWNFKKFCVGETGAEEIPR